MEKFRYLFLTEETTNVVVSILNVERAMKLLSGHKSMMGLHLSDTSLLGRACCRKLASCPERLLLCLPPAFCLLVLEVHEPLTLKRREFRRAGESESESRPIYGLEES